MSSEKMNNEVSDEDVLEPLKITCHTSDCASGLHYFKQTKKMRDEGILPKCEQCKADLVEWKKVWARDLNDAENTFKSLKFEFIRHHYWHKEFDEKAVNYALRKGKIDLLNTVEKRIRSSVQAPADAFDGRRTKWEGNPIHYGQHATATCCRKCIERWHNIPRDEELTEKQVKYFTHLVIMFLEERFPNLPVGKTKVPVIRKFDGGKNKQKRNDH
jgi:hypothetical protein